MPARFDAVKVATAVAVSGANTYYTNPFQINGFQKLSYQMKWTGTVVGAATPFIVYVSNCYDGRTAIATSVAAGDWVSYPISGGTAPAGSAGGDGISLVDVGWQWAVLAYVNASGTGTFSAWLSGG